jgi:hypothetical protein
LKTKTINKIIINKFKLFLNSINDEKVKQLVEKHTIITGGCIASMFLNEDVNDFDIYFRNKETTLAVANYYVDEFKKKPRKVEGILCNIEVIDSIDKVEIKIQSDGIASDKDVETPYQYFESARAEEAGEYVSEDIDEHEYLSAGAQQAGQIQLGKFVPVFLSSNAITLSDQVQIITRFFGSPEEIHNNFDFVHCTNYWDSRTRQLTLNSSALECILSKELRYIGSKFPVCSVFRLRKFINRGWTINAGQILKMAMQISDLNLHDPEILKDQLTGVDAAYFTQVINMINSKGNSEAVDFTYLVKVIDQVF